MDGASSAAVLDEPPVMEDAVPVEDHDPTPQDPAPRRAAAAPAADPEAAAEDGDEGASEDGHAAPGPVIARYGEHVALFVGAGLVSGAVVHFPLAPLRYGLIGAAGALVFAVASVVAERSGRGAVGTAVLAASSLALALGIGMVSGSVQHFGDIPRRAATLIPLGLVLSLVAFAVRQRFRPSPSDLAAAALWGVIAVFALSQGLDRLADAVAPPAAADGAGGHGGEGGDGGAGGHGEGHGGGHH